MRHPYRPLQVESRLVGPLPVSAWLRLKASTMISLACVGEVVVEMLGLCIGGVMSSAAVAVQLGDEEASVLEDPINLISEVRFFLDKMFYQCIRG